MSQRDLVSLACFVGFSNGFGSSPVSWGHPEGTLGSVNLETRDPRCAAQDCFFLASSVLCQVFLDALGAPGIPRGAPNDPQGTSRDPRVSQRSLLTKGLKDSENRPLNGPLGTSHSSTLRDFGRLKTRKIAIFLRKNNDFYKIGFVDKYPKNNEFSLHFRRPKRIKTDAKIYCFEASHFQHFFFDFGSVLEANNH